MLEVERRPLLEPSEFAARFDHPATPVVLEGAARGWRAVERWGPSYLRGLIGDVAIRYKLSSCRAHPDFGQTELGKMFALGKGTFGEFLDQVTTGPVDERARRLFTGDEQFLVQRREGKTTIHEGLKPLLDDVERPAIVPEERLYTVWAWFSGPGVRTWLHYDNNGCHNANVQITGSKRCVLFPPSELSKLAPFPLGGPNPAHNCSRIDVDAPDGRRFPEFAGAACMEARLEPGDLLFIPAFWFHTFVHDGEFNSNVNFWWKPEQPRMNPVAARQALLDLVARAGLDPAAPVAARELYGILDAKAVGGAGA